MTTIRFRSLGAALLVLSAGLSACANDSTSPMEPESTRAVSANVDTTKRVPTIPWTSVTTVPTIPWTSVSTVPTIPWTRIQSTASTTSGN